MTNNASSSNIKKKKKCDGRLLAWLKYAIWLASVLFIAIKSFCTSISLQPSLSQEEFDRTPRNNKIPPAVLDASTLPQPIQVARWDCHSKDTQSGTFKQFRYAFESLHYAIVNNMYWQMEPLGPSIEEGCTVPFEDILDWEALQQAFPNTIITNTHNVRINRVFVERVNSLTAVQGPDPLHLQTWARILEHVRPAPRLLQLSDQIRETLLPRRFVCLHARIEDDFKKIFENSSRYKNAKQIQSMMKRYNFGPANTDTLYLAGGVSLDLDFGFKHNVNKTSVVPVSGMLNGSVIDSEVCKHSMYHVGTAGSIWDEWLSEWRRIHNLPSLMYAGDNMPAQKVERLTKFVGSNDKTHLLPSR